MSKVDFISCPPFSFKKEKIIRVLKKYAEDEGYSIKKIQYNFLKKPSSDQNGFLIRGIFEGMLSFQVKGGKKEALEVLTRARVFKLATSLGGVESLIEHRKSSETLKTETPDNLIRLSVGIEAVEDLLQDLERMLQA